MECQNCKNQLIGKQIKFCSIKCKNEKNNKKYQKYECQKNKGMNRKLELIKIKGSKCKNCGYNKNLAALSFHHIDPKSKSFELDVRNCSNSKWSSILLEVDKCDLLCANCHMEIHHPQFNNKL